MGSGIAVSLCMIVKNEEDVLARCLDSVRGIADEIVIVDTGSTDATREIAARYTDRIFDFAWIDDFAAARNYAFDMATQEYILWLDADDLLLEEDRKKMKALKHSLGPSVDSVSMFYVLTRDEQGRPVTRIRRNRMVKRDKGFRWVGPVHEYLDVTSGAIMLSDVEITHSRIHHKSDRNIGMYERRLRAGEEFSPRDMFYYANELREHGRWEEAIGFYEKFMATEKGWVEDCIASCRRLCECNRHLGRESDALRQLTRSFEYDAPRPYFCCQLGDHFFNRQQYGPASHWYQMAITMKAADENSWGLRETSHSTWIPQLQLSVCYDRLGDHRKAALYNEMAALHLPEGDKRIEYNRGYFEPIVGEAGMREARRAARPIPLQRSPAGSPAPPQRRRRDR